MGIKKTTFLYEALYRGGPDGFQGAHLIEMERITDGDKIVADTPLLARPITVKEFGHVVGEEAAKLIEAADAARAGAAEEVAAAQAAAAEQCEAAETRAAEAVDAAKKAASEAVGAAKAAAASAAEEAREAVAKGDGLQESLDAVTAERDEMKAKLEAAASLEARLADVEKKLGAGKETR